ncbi:MAG TPA: hypothetical protein VHW23_42150 [Kofleriaceae bacterium]|jgi:sugar lactone lactonase YvrE|nr:hypothetical protein [Kofleriaceae bacterium]
MTRTPTTRRPLALLLLLLSLAGCQLALDGAGCPCADGWTCCAGANVCMREASSCPASDETIEIQPGSVHVPVGWPQRFVASEDVTWRVYEPDGGTIDADGLYQPPAVPGSYTIVAARAGAPDHFALAQVTVETWRLDTRVGGPGGRGDLDDVHGGAGGGAGDARFDQPQKLVMASTGESNIYVADCANNTIRVVAPATSVRTIAGKPPGHAFLHFTDDSSDFVDGVGEAARFRCPTGLALDDAAGILYIADRDNHAVRQMVVATGEVRPVAGAPELIAPTGARDGTGSDARFYDPVALALDGHGGLYVSESEGLIRRIELATRAVTTVAGTVGAPVRDGAGADTGLDRPMGLAWDPAGTLYIADGTSVRRFDPTTAMVTTFASPLSSARDLVLDATFGLLVTESSGGSFGGRITRVDPVTGAVSSWIGGTGSSVDGPLASAQIGDPIGITSWTPHPGHVYITDASTSTVRGVDPTLTVGTYAGALPLAQDLIADGAHGPMTADAQGHVFWFARDGIRVAPGDASLGDTAGLNRPNNLVVSSDGSRLYVIGAQDVYAADVTWDGQTPARSAFQAIAHAPSWFPPELGEVHGAALDDHGNLFVAVASSETVFRVNLASGDVVSLAGALESGHVDGSASSARFWHPIGLAYVAGNAHRNQPDRLYVADSVDHTIRMIDLSTGAVTTPFGASTDGRVVDGVGTAARFIAPAWLALDAGGNLYAADRDTVRRIELGAGTVRTFVGSGGRGVVLGGLPGSLNVASGLVARGSQELWIGNLGENVQVSAHAE